MAVEVATRTITINAAFLQEIKEVNEELWRLLGEVGATLSRRPKGSAQWRRSAESLATLRDQLAMHFALEEAFGYFEDPVDVAPRLSRRAESLRLQHATLYREIDEIVERVESMAHNRRVAARAARSLAESFEQFHRRLEDHEAMENELILQAYDDDIGVGD